MTVEDILEEIVGDFTTSMSPTLAEEVTPQNDGSVIIDGTANVREINKAFNWHLPEDDARTVNGVILEALEEIPVAGTRVRIGEYDIDILDVQDNMIKQVKVFPVKPLRESVAGNENGPAFACRAVNYYENRNYAFAFATVTIAARIVRPFSV